MAKRYENLIGQKFGYLTPIESLREEYKQGYKFKWLCKCVCEKYTKVEPKFLKSGVTKSCGCYRSKCTSDRMKYKKAKNRLAPGLARARCVFNNYKRGALKYRHITFCLSFEEFIEVTSKDCFYCKKPPSNLSTTKDPHNGDYIYNGIDRLDSTIGYEKDNCVPCCMICNRSKSNLSLQEFRDWIIEIYHNYVKNEDYIETLGPLEKLR